MTERTEHDDDVHEQMIVSMAQVFDLMDAHTVEAWAGLTGLQIQLVRVVATGMRVDRQSLSTWTRTSRSALVPSLGALLQRRILIEQLDPDGPYLTVGPGGRALLDTVRHARTDWIREACTTARPEVDEVELRRTIDVLRRIVDGA